MRRVRDEVVRGGEESLSGRYKQKEFTMFKSQNVSGLHALKGCESLFPPAAYNKRYFPWFPFGIFSSQHVYLQVI